MQTLFIKELTGVEALAHVTTSTTNIKLYSCSSYWIRFRKI